jgi:tRNA (cmo5U34)-methyltransferase
MSMTIPRDWTFQTSDVANEFDQHVREQLPWYDLTTGVVAHVARHYIPEGGRVYDIGASTGNIGAALADTLISRRAEFVPIDNSAAMADIYRGPGDLIVADAADFDYQPFDLAVLFLCLMFVPPSKREGFVSRLRDRLRPGGAIIIFDKCEPATGYVATVLWRLALAGKAAAGVDAREILAKELSLGGVQRPINPQEIAPSTEIFRFGDFAGWVIEK